MRCVVVALAVGMAGLGCSSATPSADDAGVEAGGPCATSADCPSGTECGYPLDGGCSATLRCIATPFQGECKGQPACACDGTSITVCGGAPKPVRSVGYCAAPCGGDACGSGICCEACDVTGYAPPTMGTPATSLGSCTEQELQEFVAACFSATASQTTCDAWLAADAGACGTCVTPVLQTNASWGPFVCATSTSACNPNVGGCVDLVLGDVASEADTGGPGSCGDLVTTENGCLTYACLDCNAADYPTCEQSALTNECTNYRSQIEATTGPCAGLHGDASVDASVCAPQADSDYIAFANVFCGTGP